MFDENKNIYLILVFGYEVTEQVNAQNQNIENRKLREHDLDKKVKQRTSELNESNILLE